MLTGKLTGIDIVKPVFISGLARAGSTLLLEFVASLPGIATHRYRDYPFLFTPFWWNQFLDRVPTKTEQPRERSHRDGIFVTQESPEAMEEILWMAFFPEMHNPKVSSILATDTSNPRFERFYRDHIRKVLVLRGARRFASKANYHATRLGYLARLFPDARFIIPVRNPENHIASLTKQHRLICEGQKGNPRALDYFRTVGHFEFGLDRRPIHVTRSETERISLEWNGGNEVRGWALYWSMIHTYLAELLESNRTLAQAALVVRFEDLCAQPVEQLRRIANHCELNGDEQDLSTFAERIRQPNYYRSSLSQHETTLVRELTGIAAQRFGYTL